MKQKRTNDHSLMICWVMVKVGREGGGGAEGSEEEGAGPKTFNYFHLRTPVHNILYILRSNGAFSPVRENCKARDLIEKIKFK